MKEIKDLIESIKTTSEYSKYIQAKKDLKDVLKGGKDYPSCSFMDISIRDDRFEARKVIVPRPDISDSAADVLTEPIVVCRASGTCVVPKKSQRNN